MLLTVGAWSVCAVQISIAGVARSGVRMDPHFLELDDIDELTTEGAWLFPKLRVVEVYMAFFRVWLRRELRRGKYKDLDETELDAVLSQTEAKILKFCSRLAFAMFKRGVTSYKQEALPAATPALAAADSEMSAKAKAKAKRSAQSKPVSGWLA